MRLKKVGSLALVPAGILLGASGVRASLDPFPPQVSITDNGPTITVAVSMAVSAQSQIKTGDRFSLFDVLPGAGTESGVVMPALWAQEPDEKVASGILLNANPFQDNSSDYNIVFQYTGASPVIGPASVGTFSFNLPETAAAFLADLPNAGAVDGGASYEVSPNAGIQLTNTIGVPVGVPAPDSGATVLAALACFGGLTLLRRRRPA